MFMVVNGHKSKRKKLKLFSVFLSSPLQTKLMPHEWPDSEFNDIFMAMINRHRFLMPVTFSNLYYGHYLLLFYIYKWPSFMGD